MSLELGLRNSEAENHLLAPQEQGGSRSESFSTDGNALDDERMTLLDKAAIPADSSARDVQGIDRHEIFKVQALTPL